jgi:predicted nucleic acid-binding protein
LRNSIRLLEDVKEAYAAVRVDVLAAVALAKARDPMFGSFEETRAKIAAHTKNLTVLMNRGTESGVPEDVRQLLLNNRYPTDQFISAANGLPDQLEKGFESATPQLTIFLKSFDHLQQTTAATISRFHGLWEVDRAQGVLFAERVQNTVVTTLLLGVACIIVLVLITLRSILRPIGDVISALGISASEVDGSAQKMSLYAEDLAQSATQQAAAVQESVASMTEMSSMIAQTSDSSSESLANIRRMAERTEDGNRIMERLASSTEAINQANAQLREMVDIIAEISSKTSVINDIVFKTQLLSFNASIEAARAGQHGRGFAVVAEEFGNLAEMSGQAAKEIQALLETSKKHVSEIVEMTHQRVSDGQAVSKEALAVFHEISRETSQMTKQIQRISEATREQQIGVQQTSTAMNQMDQAAQRNSLLAGDTLRSASDLSEQSRKLTNIMKGLLSLISAKRGEPRAWDNDHGKSPSRGSPAHTHVLEIDDESISLDQELLHETSSKLSTRNKHPFKSEMHAEDEEFQPYQGPAPR